jgi:hypothetical protein
MNTGLNVTYVPDPNKADGQIGTGSFAHGLPTGVPGNATEVPNPAKADGSPVVDGGMIIPTPATIDANKIMGYHIRAAIPGLTQLVFLHTTNDGGFTLLGTSALTTVKFPNLTQIDPTGAFSAALGSLIVQGNTNFTTLEIPVLTIVGWSMRVEGTGIISLSAPNLVTIGPGGFTGDDNHQCTGMSFPKLATCGGFDVDDSRLSSLDLSSLVIADGGCNVGNNNTTSADGNRLTSVSLPKLTSVGTEGTFKCSNMSTLTSLSTPLLAFTKICQIFNTGLATISLPALTNASEFYCYGNTSLTSISLPLMSDTVIFDCHGNTVLTTLSLPAVAGDGLFTVDASSCTLLTTFTTSAFFQDGGSINFHGCALNATSVNLILSKAVATGMTSGTIDLAGGTNAAPTGQGITDKSDLIDAGVTVTTN